MKGEAVIEMLETYFSEVQADSWVLLGELVGFGIGIYLLAGLLYRLGLMDWRK